MAKKNCVHLLGSMDRIVEESEGRLSLTIKIRKNKNKFVYPIVEISTRKFPCGIELSKGKIVIIEGKMRTEDKEVFVDCPICARRYKEKQVYTTIVAEKMFVVDTKIEELYINKSILLGTVCKSMDFKYIESTYSEVGNMKYQVAVNSNKPNSSDYPWVSTFARQAEEDKKRIQVGSQILIEGEVVTRYVNRKFSCDCGAIIKNSYQQTEILGKTVEYLNNCKFDKSNDEMKIL